MTTAPPRTAARDDYGPPSPYLCGGHDDAANIAGRT
jgi:hypothetical protein